MVADQQYSISLYEVPLPSSRTRREMSTLLGHGFNVAVVHNPRYRDRIEPDGYASLPAPVGLPHPLITDLKRRIAQVESTSAGSPTPSRVRVWKQALNLPTPQLRVRPADLNTLVHNWIAAAEALATTTPNIFWAADLDALPPVVWAAAQCPGSKVIFDAHELFTELDYLDPLQLGEWDDIAQTFVPHADLVLTVGDEIGDVFRDRYGAARVEVIPNLAEAADVSTTTLREVIGVPRTTPLAVHIGNVVANRRPELAVDLLAQSPMLHVAFVGEVRDGLENVLLDRARELGVSDRIHLVPPVPGRQLVEFVRSADVSLILYSPRRSKHLELTMPNKLFDSLAAGLPVVATEGLAPARYVTEHGLGVTFTDGDVDSLAAAVATALDDVELARRTVASRADYLWSAGESRLLDVVRSMAAESEIEPHDHASDQRHENVSSAPGSRSGIAERVRKALAWRLRRLAVKLDV